MFWLQSGSFRIGIRLIPNRLLLKALACTSSSSSESAVPQPPAQVTDSESRRRRGFESTSEQCTSSGLQNQKVPSDGSSQKTFTNLRPSPNIRRFRMQLRNARAQSSFSKVKEEGADPEVLKTLKQLNVDSFNDNKEGSDVRNNGNYDDSELDRSAGSIISTCKNVSPMSEIAEKAKDIVDISKEEKKDETVHVNRFRKVLYTENELANSDLSLPPSRENPHPFDPSEHPDLVPPTHSRTLAQYVNHLPVLQYLVELGMDLFTVEKTTAMGRQLVRLEWDTDVLPKLSWLVGLGVPVTGLGDYLTRNPFFLIQDLNDMKARVNYLRSKRFTKEQIAKIVVTFRYWLNTDVRTIDARLGWIQKTFHLTGNEVRSLVILEPRVFMFGIGPLQRITALLAEELSFNIDEIKRIIMKEPRLFMQEPSQIAASYAYLHFSMGLSNIQIAEYPLALRCPVASLRRRHEFLAKLHRDNYAPDSEGYVSLSALLHPSDKYFAVNVARSFLVSYNAFLKKY